MNKRVQQLVEGLRLEPHPEGGYFREVYRSPHPVRPVDSRSQRSALTTIYFMLADDQFSCLHRVRSDEVWSFIEGGPLKLKWLNDDLDQVREATLALPSTDTQPVAVVPAGHWQAAQPMGDYTLVSCSVGPGFDFEDFQMLRDEEETVRLLEQRQPRLTSLL